MSFASVLVRGSRLRSGASWSARAVECTARLLFSADEEHNLCVSSVPRQKGYVDYHSVFQLGAVPGTADYYTDDYFDDESRSTTTRMLIVDRGDRPTFDPHSRITYMGRVADLAKGAWTEAERPNPEGGVLALEDHNDSSIWSELPTTCS